MTSRTFSLRALCAVGLIAFAAGYYFALRNPPTEGGLAVNAPLESSSPKKQQKTATTERDAIAKDAALAGAKGTMKERTWAILHEKDWFQRHRGITGLLQEMTAENWSSVLEVFEGIARAEGRLLQAEWQLVLMRASEVAPEAVIESARRSGRSRLEDEIGLVMGLWAAKEPARAWAWLEENAGSRRRNLELSYTVGLTRNDPDQAIAFAIDQRRDVGQPEVIRAVLEVIADGGGINAMNQWMEQVASRSDVPEQTKELFFRHAATQHERAIAAGADPSRSLQWIERFAREPWAKHWHFASIANLAARQNPAATMAWVDAVGGRLTDEQVQWCSVRVIQNWVEQSVDGALTWMKGSPSHRFREQLFQEGALALQRLGKAEEGRRWAEASGGVPFSELVQAALDHEKRRAAR